MLHAGWMLVSCYHELNLGPSWPSHTRQLTSRARAHPIPPMVGRSETNPLEIEALVVFCCFCFCWVVFWLFCSFVPAFLSRLLARMSSTTYPINCGLVIVCCRKPSTFVCEDCFQGRVTEVEQQSLVDNRQTLTKHKHTMGNENSTTGGAAKPGEKGGEGERSDSYRQNQNGEGAEADGSPIADPTNISELRIVQSPRSHNPD